MPPVLQQYQDPEDNKKVVLQVVDKLIRPQHSQVQVHGGLQKSDKKAFLKLTWKAHIGMNGWRK